MKLNKIALIISVICIVLGTTISILGIWGYIGDQGLVWRSLATIGVVLFGVVLSVGINNFINGSKK